MTTTTPARNLPPLVLAVFGMLVSILLPAVVWAQPGSASLVNNTYCTSANTGPINPTQFTLEARIQPTGPGYGRTEIGPGAAIIDKPRQGATGNFLESWGLWWSPVTQRVSFNVTHAFDSSATYLTSNAIIGVGQAAHVAATFDGTTLRLYINGVLDNSVAAASSNVYYGASEPVLIGAGNYSGGFTRRFQGLIDDVRIWDRVRSSDEIDANAVCQLPTGALPNLLAHWVFDNSSSADQSGNNRNASFVDGSPAFGPDLANPDCCSPDFNRDGVLNADDLSDYITGYFNDPADPRTDFNRDGVINADDLGDFITAYFNGC